MIRFTLISAAAFAGALAAQAGAKAEFTDVDANNDGLITEAEFVAYKTADGEYTVAEATKKFDKMAGDADVITAAAWQEAAEKRKDKKKDGSASY